MNTQTLRNVVFVLHRYIELAVGLIAILVGLTGSLLVFHSEISAFDQQRRMGTITPQAEPLPLEVILNTVKQTYAHQPDAKVLQVSFGTSLSMSTPRSMLLRSLQQFLTLANGIPDHDTIAKVLARLNPQEFEQCFHRWVESITEAIGAQVIPIDGKTVRQSFDRNQGQKAIHDIAQL